jgi:mRNA-degrading endonuclease RelE of RelBE toxin-antitoxin system
MTKTEIQIEIEESFMKDFQKLHPNDWEQILEKKLEGFLKQKLSEDENN